MTLPQVEELFDYWQDYPPAHEHLLILSHYKRPDEPKKTEAQMDPITFARAHKMKPRKRKKPDV